MTLIPAFLFIAVATFRVTRLLVRDTIFHRVRFWLGGKAPFLDDLLGCYWCAGTYVAIACTLVALLFVPMSFFVFVGFALGSMVATGVLGTVLDFLER